MDAGIDEMAQIAGFVKEPDSETVKSSLTDDAHRDLTLAFGRLKGALEGDLRLYDGARFNHLQLGDLIAGADFDVVLVDNIESVRRSPEYPIGDDPLWAVGDELNRARIGCNIPLIVGCSMNTKEVWPDPLFSIPEPLEGTASVVLTLVDGHGGIQPQMVKHRNGPVVDLGFIKLRKMPGGRLVEEVS